MPIDTSIYNQLLRPPKSVAEYDAEATQGQTNKLALAMNQAKMGEYQRGVQQENALADAYRGATGADGAIDRTKLYTGLAQSGLGAKLPGVQKGFADQDKALLESHKAKLETGLKQYEAMAQVMSGVTDQASYDQAKQQAAQIMGPEAAASIPPVYDAAAVEAGRLKAMGVKDQMEFHYKEISSKLDADKFGETVRNNKEQTDTSRANNSATVGATIRGQNMVDARTRESNQLPRGQVVQTDNGPMLVDPRGGTSRPVTGPDGQSLAPKMKSLPAPIQKALLENDAALRKVDAALLSLDSYPDAFGLKNMLGDTIRQRTDPQGVKGRALVADIGSLKLHDRSGAAVTASETPRLKPFIPAATDEVATIKEKLGLFKQEYQAIQSDINNTYTREQGYRAPAAAAKPASEGVKFLGFE